MSHKLVRATYLAKYDAQIGRKLNRHSGRIPEKALQDNHGQFSIATGYFKEASGLRLLIGNEQLSTRMPGCSAKSRQKALSLKN